MGTDTIPTRSDSTTILATWWNVFKSVLDGDFVPRNGSGVAAALAGSLGSSTYPWLKAFIGAAASQISLEETGGTFIIKVAGSTVATFSSTGLTRASLQALGHQLSSSCGTFTMSSGTPTDVTNLTVNITTHGRPVFLILISDSSFGSVGAGDTTDICTATIYFCRAGSAISQQSIKSQMNGSSANIAALSLPPGAFSHFDPVAAGTYAYKVQASGSGTSVLNCKLLAFELA